MPAKVVGYITCPYASAARPMHMRLRELDCRERTYVAVHVFHPQIHNPTMLVSLTVGKVDAGVAVLLTEDKRLVCAQLRCSIPVLPALRSLPARRSNSPRFFSPQTFPRVAL